MVACSPRALETTTTTAGTRRGRRDRRRGRRRPDGEEFRGVTGCGFPASNCGENGTPVWSGPRTRAHGRRHGEAAANFMDYRRLAEGKTSHGGGGGDDEEGKVA